MAVKVNGVGRAHAASLISAGRVDRTSLWSFSAADANAILRNDNWNEYAKWFLAVDDAEPINTRGRYKYPFGKNGKTYRSGVIAAKSRAAGQHATAVESAATALLEKIDGSAESNNK
jgi:hypothetical protein